MEPDVKPKRTRKSRKNKISPLNETILSHLKLEKWEQICRSIQDFIKNKSSDFILLYSDKNAFIVGKKVVITEIIENNNNTFQPLESRIKKNHFKYLLIVNSELNNPSNSVKKLNSLIEQHIFFKSPIFCPDTAKSMLSILTEFH